MSDKTLTGTFVTKIDGQWQRLPAQGTGRNWATVDGRHQFEATIHAALSDSQGISGIRSIPIYNTWGDVPPEVPYSGRSYVVLKD